MNRLQSFRVKVKEVLTILPVALLIGLGVVAAVVPERAYAATSSVPEMIPSTGKDFWLTYMYNFGQNNDDVDLEIFVVAMRSDAVVTITTGDGTVLASGVAVSAGSAYTLTIPTLLRDKVYNTSSDVKKKTGVHVQASSDVSVYFRNGYSSGSDYSYDNSHAISTDALGTEYMIQTYYRDMMNNEFAIVATADGTTVEVTLSTAALKPSESPTDLYDAGTMLTRSLNAGEVIQIKGARYNSSGRGDLSGTTIKSDKPIAVFNGGVKASVPLNTGYNGDHTVDPAIPVSAWGKRFVAMEMSGFPDRKSTDDGGLVETSSPTQYMLTAMYEGTQVKVDGVTICTLDSGENIPYDKISSMYYSKIRVDYNETPKLVETSNPVVLYAYMSSGAVNAYDYEVFSEPALALIPDVNKGVDTSYIYCAPTPSSIHFANVVVPASGVSDMKLNGVDVSGEFTTLSGTFDGYSKNYAYARLSLNSGVNILTNNSAKFVAVSYSTEMYAAIAEASVTAFNLAPIAPIVWIDGNEVVDHSILEYCNRHPGVNFRALVDYPHDSVRWHLGEGATSTELNASHMYGRTVGEADTTHNVSFFIFRHSPISGVKDTDSVCVSLRVHPVYYDTLETWVSAKALTYEWVNSSLHAFGLSNRGQYDLRYKDGDPVKGDAVDDKNGRRAAITYGKDATNPLHKWTNPDEPEITEIFDSLVYITSTHGCDSIFYLKLHVTKNILMPVENRTICQQEALAWAGHAAGAGHRMSRKNLTTNVTIYNVDGSGADMFKTDEYGTFEIRDTLVSKVFPYPDSIHVMNLTVYIKPTMGLTAPDAICQTDDDELPVAYTTTDANRFTYSLKNSSNVEVKSGTINSPGATGTLTITGMGTLPYGAYKLYATAYSEHDCHSVEASVDVTINVKPTLALNDIDPQCYPAAAFEVSYDHTNATKVFYRVLQGETVKKAWTEETVVAAKKFTISTEGWDAATYTVQAYSQSADGCQSVQQEKTFTIIVQPTVTSVMVANACDAETATELAFTTAHATTYNYYIVGQTTLKATPVATTDGSHTADLDISMLAAGDYTLKIVVNSATCKSDTVSADFTIYPMPTATITSLPADLNSCAPGTSNKTVNYTTTNASQIKWQLTTPHAVKDYDYAAVGSSLTVLQDSLVCPGTYKVKITGVKSAAPMNCEVLNPAGGEVTFTMYNPAAITLNDIAAVCAGNAVTSTYTAEYTDSYTYEVRRKTGNVLKGSGSSTTINGTIDLSKTDTLPAGTYVLSVTATNTNNCGSSSASKEFVINPIPVINSLSTPDNVCETEVASRDVSFTATDAANILYTLKKGATVWNAENSVAVGAGKFSIKTDTLSAGDYTVEAKPVSGAGCTGAVKSVNFTVYPHPTVTLPASLPNACFGEESLTINYSTTYAATYAYTLADKDGNALTPGSGAAVASGSIVVPLTATMTAAKSPYKFRIEVTSDKGCKSGWVEKTFTIYPKPTAGITSVESKCDNETSVAVVYTQTNATKYEYRVFKSDVVAPVLTVTDQDVAGTTFNVDISTLDAGSYELRLVAKSATCESDTAKKSFDIWPLPVISTLDNTTPCEGESVVKVPYTATNASTFSYQVLDGSTPVKTVATATVADGKIEVDIDGLTTGGAVTKAYTLSVTAKSEYDCETAAAKTATITLKAKPVVTLSSVTNTCAGTGAAITVAYTGLTTTKLDYIVRKGGVDTSVSESKTGLTPEVDGSFVISGAELEALAAGTDYEVEVIAQGDNGCPSIGVDQVKAFTIYPLPTVTVKSGYEEITVCEGREDAVFELTTSDNASTYSYETGALGLTATDQPVVDKKIKITLSKTDLKDGDFTLTVTVKSAAPQSCTSVAATATLHVNNRPTLKIDDIAAKCHPISSFTVSYTPTDAKYVKWTVDNKITTEQTHTVPNAAPYQFTISTDGWAAGTYTLRAKPVSALDCDSAAVVKTFTINAKPELSNLHAYNECTNQFVNVFFDHNGVGNRIEWEVLGTTCHGEEDITNPSSGIAHIAPNSLPAGDYTFRGKMVNTTTGCESEPKDLNFTLWPRAEISLLKDSAFCSPADKSYVRYAATNAASYTYRLTGHGIDSYLSGSGTMTSAGLIEVNTNGLEGGYAYTLTVTAASEHDCKSDEKTATITLYPQPAITSLAKVDSVCEKHSPSAIALTMTGATKYNYEVLKDGESTPKEQKTGETASSITLNTSTWAAGKYTLKVTAVSDLNCGSDVEERVFLIYPQPKVTALGSATICETDAEASFSFTMTDAKTYSYDLKNGSDVSVASSASPQNVPAGGSGNIVINTAALPDGTYTLHVVATSDKGCVSDEKTATLTINNQPTIVSLTVPDICNEDPAGLNFTYEVSTDANRYKLFVWKADRSKHMGGEGNFALPSNPTGTIHKSFIPWGAPIGAGSYVAVMQVRNATTGCESDSVVVPFTIHPVPTVNNAFTIEAVCQNGSPRVDFKHTHGATVKYWIDGVEKSAVAINGTQDAAWFNADITGIAAGTNHKMKLQVISGTSPACESAESTERTFTIYPLPTITTYDTTAIYPVASVDVRYSAENASTYTYVMTGTGIPSLNPGTGSGTFSGGKIPVNTANLAPGTYELTVTAKSATSAGGCEKTATSTIVIYDPTSIEITEPIAGKCAENTTDKISITITTTFADKYSYVVKLGETEIESKTDQATTNNGATPFEKTFQLDKTTWTAGTYSISITAKNSDTGVTKDDASTFTIYPTPEITFTQPSAICEAEVSSVNVTYTNTGNYANKIKYHVDKLLPIPTADIVAEQEISANGTITLSATDTWADGTYRIFATPSSEHGCEGAEKYTDLVVNNQPEATLNPIEENICAGTGYLNATFTASTDARAYAFRILNSSDLPVSGYAGGSAILAPYGGGSFAVDVHTLPVGTNYKLELKTQTEAGCWSVADTKQFSVRDTFLFTTEAKICKSETYQWNYGTHPTVDITGASKGAGVHTIDSVYKTVYGCDSVYRLVLTVGEEYEIVENKTVCENKPFSWRGLDFAGRENGVYDDIHTDSLTVQGCDSIFKLHLTVEDSPAPIVTNANICYGESYDWTVEDCEGHQVTLMKGLTESTHQVDTLICSDPDACNPIYELNLTVWPEYAKTDAPVHLCSGDAYLWRGGQTLTEAGEYEYRVADVAPNGCDSVYRITVTKLVPEQKTIAQTVCYGEDVIFNGKTYSDRPVGQQVLLDTLKSKAGCDSVYLRLNLTVGERYYDSVTVTTCDKYVWEAVNGNTYTKSGIYREELSTINGCDSIFVLNLTINEKFEENETYDIWNTQLPFTVHEHTFTEAGTFDREYKSVGGCDSIYHITVIVHEAPLPKDTTDIKICADAAPYSWQGNDYASSGWYSVTENDGTKDVAIHVLHLTVNDTYSDTTYVHACGSYTWRGNDYTATGVYSVGLTSICGCDSTIVLKLTVDAPSSSMQDVTVCQYELVTVGNQTFVADETSYAPIVETLTNAKGCDSTITYNVTVSTRTYEDVENASFCEGTEYTWRGKTFTTANTYYDTTFTAGCATKIYTLNLTAKPQYRIDEDVEVSDLALPYEWHGQQLSTNGDYYDNLTAISGCDSIHHIHFHVNWVTRDTVDAQGCESYTWSVSGKTYTETGLYSDTVFTDAPTNKEYEVVHFCDVTIHHSFSEAEPAFTICSNEAFTWHALHGRRLSSGNR